jgi:hypothetical protein
MSVGDDVLHLGIATLQITGRVASIAITLRVVASDLG